METAAAMNNPRRVHEENQPQMTLINADTQAATPQRAYLRPSASSAVHPSRTFRADV